MQRSIDGKLPPASAAKQSGAGVNASGAIDLEERREHRRRPRARYEVDGQMEVAGATKRGGGLTVRTRDVSDIGIALRCTESVATGSPVRLSLVTPEGTRLNLRGSVVRLKLLEDGGYELGVRFAEEQPTLSAWRVEMKSR